MTQVIVMLARKLASLFSPQPRRGEGKKPLLAIPAAPDWLDEDRKHLKTFLSNPTGQALLTRARAREAATCIAACQGKCDPKQAAGFSDAINWLESLATDLPAASADQGAITDNPAGEREFADSVLAT